MRFQSYCFQQKNDTPVFWKGFRFPENLFQSSSIENIQTSSYCHLKKADLSNGRLFWKSLVPFYRRTYSISVGFRIKRLTETCFPMLRQKLAQILLYFIAWKFRGHFNFAIFWGKIAFRGIFISRFRQIDEFHGILISRFEQKIRIWGHFNFVVQAKNENGKWLVCLENVCFYLWWKSIKAFLGDNLYIIFL